LPAKSNTRAEVVALPQRDGFAPLLKSWERDLDSRVLDGTVRQLGPRTRDSYLDAANRFADFLRAADGGPGGWENVTRDHVRAFLDHCRANARKANAGGVAVRHRSLRVFFGWLEAEHAVPSPMRGLPAPEVVDDPPPCLSETQRDAILNLGRNGATFRTRRDHALAALFLTTPARLEEVAELRVPDVDLDHRRVTTVSKGRRRDEYPLSGDAVRALDRYLLAREDYLDRLRQELGFERVRAFEDYLFLGPKGHLTKSGVNQVMRKRALEVGVGEFHVHMTRHTSSIAGRAPTATW
jgi:site-specific recombinase XerD